MREGEGGGGIRVGLAAMGVAASGVALAVVGRHFGYPLLEDLAGPAVTLLGAAIWLGYRATRVRRR